MNDLQVIQRVLTGDVDSFRCLVERYQRPLFSLIRNLTPAGSDHEDIAQDVFLTVFRNLAMFDADRAAFSTWLFTIARNRCLNERSRRRPVARGELPEGIDTRAPDQEAAEAELFRQFD